MNIACCVLCYVSANASSTPTKVKTLHILRFLSFYFLYVNCFNCYLYATQEFHWKLAAAVPVPFVFTTTTISNTTKYFKIKCCCVFLLHYTHRAHFYKTLSNYKLHDHDSDIKTCFLAFFKKIVWYLGL